MSQDLLQRRDGRIGIVISATVVLQTAFALIWAGGAAERLGQLERQAERRSDRADEILERTTRLEAQAVAMRVSLTRIEAKLDRPVAEGDGR
ncbi:MAG: hypothetical protein ACFB00_11765 [Parvularculaceae bacterium]